LKLLVQIWVDRAMGCCGAEIDSAVQSLWARIGGFFWLENKPFDAGGWGDDADRDGVELGVVLLRNMDRGLKLGSTCERMACTTSICWIRWRKLRRSAIFIFIFIFIMEQESHLKRNFNVQFFFFFLSSFLIFSSGHIQVYMDYKNKNW
jgi:hypothetical protein